MSKKTGVVLAVLGMCALSVFLVNCGSSSSRPTGLLYVLSQAEFNVSSYAMDLDDGFLSLITGNLPATCPTAPCTLPLSISLDPKEETAFVLNQGSISGYTINSDGSLSSPTGGATLTQMALAMTRDAAGAFMFVISPGTNAASNPNCSQQIVTDLTCPSISVFSTTPGSTSATLTGNDCPTTNAPCPYLLNRIPTALSVITFTPPQGGTAQTLLFVTSNQDLTPAQNDQELSVYAVDSSGNLTEQENSPYTTQVNPGVVLAVNTNPAGQNTGGVFVYVGNQGSVTGSVGVFQICTNVEANPACAAPNVLVSVGTPTSIGINPNAMIVDPTNSFLYIACTGSNAIYAYHMIPGTGLLTPLNPLSVATGATPTALAMHPNYNGGAEFLYVSNYTGSSVTGFTVNVTTGTLSNPQLTLFPPGEPTGIAGH